MVKEDLLRVLVVGGAGYIGSHVSRLLRRRGHAVVVYDNLSTGHSFLVGDSELVIGDIGDASAIAPLLGRVDAVMHFAAFAYVGESMRDPRKYFRNNIASSLVLLNSVIDAGIKHFVFSSSCAVYGVPPALPVTEDAPRHPINPYGVSKVFFENALEAYDRAYGLRYASLRYFNAAGADEGGEIGELHCPETHVIPLALAAAGSPRSVFNLYGDDYPTPDGTCIRDYIHVNDLAEGHLAALEYLVHGGQSLHVNLGTGQGHSLLQLTTVVEEVTRSRVQVSVGPRRLGDPPELVADPSRAKQTLGWKATRSLHDIVSTAWQWMQSHATKISQN